MIGHDRYEMQKKLGEGASASVLLAEDKLTGQFVAVKVAHEILARHARFAGRWQREVIVLQTLQHPRVVPLIDATFVQGKPLTMVMANATEGALEDKLTDGCSVKEALVWLLQTLEGLAHIHSFDVVHQDIKPDNVLISPEGTAWLADFSVARTRAELLTNPQDVTGTPGWYSPEQRLRLPSEIGPWSDLYSWGQMLKQILASISYKTKELESIVEGCTRIDPQQRFRSSSELLRPMQQAIDSIPATVLNRQFTLKHSRGMNKLLKKGFDFPSDFVPDSIQGKCIEDWSFVQKSQPTFSPSLLSVVPRYRPRQEVTERLWEFARSVRDEQCAKVVFVRGPKGVGKKDLVRKFTRGLETQGIMDTMILSYYQNGSFDDGYRGAVQHLLSPWGEDRESFVARVQRWLAREKQIPIESTYREAVGLAKWCGFLEANEQAVDNGLGLIFLFQHLQYLSWKGGVVLILEDPEFCNTIGDGLDICEALLGEIFSDRPILVLVTVSDSEVEKRPLVQHKMSILKKMGAEEITVSPWSDQDVLHHIEGVCLISEQQKPDVLNFCQGKIDRANMFVQSVALRGCLEWAPENHQFRWKDNEGIVKEEVFFHDYFDLLYQQVPQPNLATEVLGVMVCSSEPVEQLLLNQISATGLQELIQVGLLSQQERSIRFTYPELRDVVTEWILDKLEFVEIQRKIARAWMALVDRWGLRLDLQIGEAWLAAEEPSIALPFLLLAIQDARNAWLWERTEQIADLIERAAELCGSQVGLLEGRLTRLEVRLKLNHFQGVSEWINRIQGMDGVDDKNRGRLCLVEAGYLMNRKEWVEANQKLKQALNCFPAHIDRRGRSQTFIKQGYLLLQLNRLEGAADRFAQANIISPKSTMEWVESQARLIEVRLRLGWVEGLPKQIDTMWRVTQNNADIHHMAHATYAAGLLFVHQLKLEEALIRLQTTQALAASCGNSHLRAQSLEYQGAVYFLAGRWAEAKAVQKQLVFHYQLRHRRDHRRVAMLRLRCAYALDKNDSSNIWKIEIQDLPKTFVHVQYWWWILQLLRPENHTVQIRNYWEQAQMVGLPKIWDISMYRVLRHLTESEQYSCIHDAIHEEIRLRYPQHHRLFGKIEPLRSTN